MKVLHIGQIPKELGGSYTTGVANVIKELIESKNHDVEYAVYATNLFKKNSNIEFPCQIFGNQYTSFFDFIKFFLTSIALCSIYYKLPGVNPLRFIFYEYNIRRVIKLYNPDIIHCHGITQFIPAFFASNLKIPCLLTLHGFFYNKTNDLKYNHFFEMSIQYSNHITVLTKEMEEEVNLSFPGKYIYIVSNGTNTERFFFHKDSRVLIRKKHNLSNKITFITVGSIQKRKGQLAFIKYLYYSELTNYKYIIIGTGPQTNEIKDFISSHDISHNVEIIGYVSNNELYKYYSAADIYAHVSFSEGQSLSEIEASSTGLKIIVNNPIKGTISGDINDKSKYLLIDTNSNNYSSFVEWCKSNPYKRKSNKNFSWNRINNAYKQVYNTLTKKND